MSEHMGFGNAEVKTEGSIIEANRLSRAEDAYWSSFRGRLHRFFYKVGRAWDDLWQIDRGW